MEIRTGQIGVFKNEQFNLVVQDYPSCRLIIRKEEITIVQKNIGFKEYAKSIFILDITCPEIDSAFNVFTYCTYKNFKFQVTDISKNNKVRIWPSIEAQSYFGDYARHGHDPHLDVEKGELEEIWEERSPIEGFKFDVNPIFYIKSNGNL
jgi:hypothetical protein